MLKLLLLNLVSSTLAFVAQDPNFVDENGMNNVLAREQVMFRVDDYDDNFNDMGEHVRVKREVKMNKNWPWKAESKDKTKFQRAPMPQYR